MYSGAKGYVFLLIALSIKIDIWKIFAIKERSHTYIEEIIGWEWQITRGRSEDNIVFIFWISQLPVCQP